MHNDSFAETIEKMCKPNLNGNLNPCYGNPQYSTSAYKQYGKERIDKAMREYRESHEEFRN